MTSSQFEGLLTTLGGYVIIAAFLVLFYYVFSVLHLHRIKRVFGFCYVVVKVKFKGNWKTRGYVPFISIMLLHHHMLFTSSTYILLNIIQIS